jgi:site-specific DNA-methyltransferase (adenine-specific)
LGGASWGELMIDIFQEDCLTGGKILENSVDLGIYDPPFGINESGFNKYYKRESSNVIGGYEEAPEDYGEWTQRWMTEAVRALKENGTMYIVMGHTQLRHILNAAHHLGLHEINHLIWKYNFGVYTKRKFVTSHYHILHYSKFSKANITFNLNCRFGSQERDAKHSLLYRDLEDVFVINRDYSPNEMKNQNKLPEELIRKLIMYSSNPGDRVCDFFMGNFTTAYASLKLGRSVCGYELNKNAFDYHIDRLGDIEFGGDLKTMKQVENIVPLNQGKKISPEEVNSICADYHEMNNAKMRKCDISLKLQEKYERGRFAIKNILDKHLDSVL